MDRLNYMSMAVTYHCVTVGVVHPRPTTLSRLTSKDGVHMVIVGQKTNNGGKKFKSQNKKFLG